MACLILCLLPACTAALRPEAGEKEIEYPAPGTTVGGLLFVPEIKGRRPAVIVNPGGSGGIDKNIILLCRFLKEQGYVVAAPRFRPPDPKEVSPLKRLFDRGKIKDSLALIPYLKGLEYVDPENIFMVGHSVGGFVTYGASVETREIKAFVAISGVAWSFYCNQEHIRGPVLIIHGDRDTRVDVADVEWAEGALKRNNEVYEVKIYSGAGHNLFARNTRERLYRDILEWLERWGRETAAR